MSLIENEQQLEERLSTPNGKDVESMRRLTGGLIILGAGGKMGPSLAKLAKRASDAAGTSRRVIAVSRYSNRQSRDDLEDAGVETVSCDLLDRDEVAKLPECENVLFLAGRKFGSSDRSDLTWAMNTIVPANAAYRYRDSRIVAFSTGNVYPFVNTDSNGSVETDEPQPRGEYAQSCLGRERVFEFVSREYGTRCLIFRLNYAVDLRYGALVDIARKVYDGRAVDLTVSHFNAIWQGDANSYALRCLELCESPPRFLNVTGPEIVSVREAADFYAGRFGREAVFRGSESGDALLNNASLCRKLLGEAEVKIEELMEWVAHWVETGGRSLNLPTKFEVSDGKF
ncbi:MAG TPA: NAD(P)-dependent oxidoreductase [Blastocatellia bacterium]|nr:NAD(P)-dependent oxidoreductase [Blastocatellia bacterium]